LSASKIRRRKVACSSSSEERPYAELIESGYDPADLYCRDAIDEMFTADEAASLTSWLNANRGHQFGDDELDRAMAGDTRTFEVALPIAANIIGFGAISIGGGNDCIVVNEIADIAKSPLGFAVEGYYDLRHHEPLDRSIPARHQFCSLYIMDGRVIHDYAELLDLWRAGRIKAEDHGYLPGSCADVPPIDNEGIPF